MLFVFTAWDRGTQIVMVATPSFYSIVVKFYASNTVIPFIVADISALILLPSHTRCTCGDLLIVEFLCVLEKYDTFG